MGVVNLIDLLIAALDQQVFVEPWSQGVQYALTRCTVSMRLPTAMVFRNVSGAHGGLLNGMHLGLKFIAERT